LFEKRAIVVGRALAQTVARLARHRGSVKKSQLMNLENFKLRKNNYRTETEIRAIELRI
jgi:hypothetical protein